MPLSEEESDFLRLLILVVKVAPLAVRHLFNQKFPPSNLKADLQSNKAILNNLKTKRIINSAQWDLLFPPSGGATCSTTFDVTLLICLLRNIIPAGSSTPAIPPPLTGFDKLPQSTDHSAGADLARIKHFRNFLAHHKEAKIPRTDFNSAWTDLCEAIRRLGGGSYDKDCVDLRVTSLDESHKQIYIEIIKTQAELETVKTEVLKTQSEVESVKIKTQTDLETVKTEVSKAQSEVESVKIKTQTDLETVKTEVSKAQSEVESVKIKTQTDLETVKTEVSKAQSEVESVKIKTQTDLETVKTEVSKAQSEVESVKIKTQTDLETVKTEVSKTQSEVESVKIKTQTDLETVKTEVSKTQSEVESVKIKTQTDLESVKRKAESDIESVKKELSAVKIAQGEKEESLPKHMKEMHKSYVNGWEKDEKTFTVTRATKQVASLIKENNVVVVVGSSGSGKSSIIHHVALNLKTEYEYDIIPIVTSPVDIIRYRDVNKNQLFVIDDLCGKNYLDETDLEAWKNKSKIIEKLFPEPSNEQGKLKILVSCRLQIFNTDKFKNLHLFTKEAVDLQSQKYCLLADEKLKMIQKYLKVTEEDWQEINKDLAGCQYFPLLCKLGQDKNVEEFKHLIASPIDCIRKDLRDTIQNKPMENCALVLCVLFPDGFHEDFIDPETRPQDVQQKITDIINTYEINLANERNRAHLSEAFERLDGTYVKKIGQEYSISHDKLFDMVAVECSNKVTELFIKYSPPTILEQLFRFRTLFEYNQDELLIYLNEKDEKKYFNRIFKDLEVNSYKPFFHNQQLKEEKYRRKVMEYIELNKESCDELFRRLDREGMAEERKYHSGNAYTTPVIEATKTGFYDLVQYFIQINCDCNKKDNDGVFRHSPLYYCCENGFANVTDLLMRQGVEYCHELVVACVFGKIDVVRVMADSGGDLSVCSSEYGWTPLTAACFWGRSEVVKLLLEKGADPLQTDRWGRTALNAARRWEREMVTRDDTIINILKSHMKQ